MHRNPIEEYKRKQAQRRAAQERREDRRASWLKWGVTTAIAVVALILALFALFD